MKYIILLTILTFSFSNAEINNVCPAYLDYLTIFLNKKCWYDPDVLGDIESIVSHHGFKVEKYSVDTWDGYTLDIFRIPSRKNETSDTKKQPLLFFHGINRDAKCFLLVGEESLPFYYVDKGYDVWLANARGTMPYSRHKKYTRNDKEFWNFSFHEIGTIDVPVIIDKITEVTNQTGNTIYVGHSMGTSIGFVYSSVNKTHAKTNLKGLIALAPIANLNDISIPGIHPISAVGEAIAALVRLLGFNYLSSLYLFKSCTALPLLETCQFVIEFVSGFSKPNKYPKILPIFTAHVDSPIALNTVLHYSQIVNSKGKFRQFDHGKAKNQELYGSPEPPYYDLQNIPINVDLIYGNSDRIGVQKDAEHLYSLLPKNMKSIDSLPKNPSNKWAHEDFLYALNIDELYEKMDALLEKYKS